MPSRQKSAIQRSVQFQNTSKMLYESVDNYNPLSCIDNSIRLNNQRDLNDFSSQSIVCAMDRFVKAVNEMNETVMVPCRLLDVEVDSQKKTTKLPKLLKGGGDPYNYYSVLNSVKNDLILGATSNDDEKPSDRTSSMQPSINITRWAEEESDTKKEAFRRQSTLSLASVSSTTSEGEISSEAFSESTSNTEEDDGSSEGDDNTVAPSSVTEALHAHLVGLHSCLKNLTDTAVYITDCYKEAVNL